jgi:hypothetical protein
VENGPDVALSTNKAGEFSWALEGNMAIGGHNIFPGEGILGSVYGEGIALNGIGEFQSLFGVENFLGILGNSFPYF